MAKSNSFILFTGQRSRQANNTIGVSKNRRLLIPDTIREAMHADHVQLYWDNEQKRLKVQPSKEGEPGAYKLQHNKHQSISTTSLAALFTHYRVDAKETRHYAVDPVDNDGFVLELADNLVPLES